MSDSTTPIAVVAIITAIGSLATIIFKYVRHSECLGCLKCDTRTPPQTPNIQITTPPQTPAQNRKIKNDDNIRECDV